MRIYLQGPYEQKAKESEFYALRFSVDFPPYPVHRDEEGYGFEGNEEHLKRLGKFAKVIPERGKKDKNRISEAIV
jgi:hypothetical protein